MKYDVASDLHTDINHSLGSLNWEELRNKGSQLLVIAGDTANNFERSTAVVADAAKVYQHVVFVDGNHEHYENYERQKTVYGLMNEFLEFAKSISNVHYLQGGNKIFRFNDVAFVGANSWYDFQYIPETSNFRESTEMWERYSNDANPKTIGFGTIDGLYWPEIIAKEQANRMVESVSKLQDDEYVNKIVIVTHTVPCSNGLIWKEHDPTWNILNGAYSNSRIEKVWEADKNKKIIHSLYGHTHAPFDFYDHDGIRFIANPRGYVHVETELAQNWTPLQLDTNDERGVEVSAFGPIER